MPHVFTHLYGALFGASSQRREKREWKRSLAEATHDEHIRSFLATNRPRASKGRVGAPKKRVRFRDSVVLKNEQEELWGIEKNKFRRGRRRGDGHGHVRLRSENRSRSRSRGPRDAQLFCRGMGATIAVPNARNRTRAERTHHGNRCSCGRSCTHFERKRVPLGVIGKERNGTRESRGRSQSGKPNDKLHHQGRFLQERGRIPATETDIDGHQRSRSGSRKARAMSNTGIKRREVSPRVKVCISDQQARNRFRTR